VYIYIYIYIYTHTHTHTRARAHTHSVGILWTSDRPVAETSDNTQHLHETDICAVSGIRTNSPSKRTDADRLVRPHG